MNSFTPNDFGDSPAQKKWFFGGLGPWNVKLGLNLPTRVGTPGFVLENFDVFSEGGLGAEKKI